MISRIFIASILFLFVFSCSTTKNNRETKIVDQRPGVKCMENSPERRGEEGCTILANRSLITAPSNKVYWHIDRYDSLKTAMKAAGPNGFAAAAHGFFWLMTVEMKEEDDHHGGQHVAWIGPVDLPVKESYSMRILSSLLMPGSTTPIHTHAGPEFFYIIDGEQCIETPELAQHLSAGQSYVVPGGTVHRGRVLGSRPRRALALNLYNTTLPVSQDLEKPPQMASCK